MWADNETDTDLLGFAVHKDLILNLITNPDLLPLTVGVFGDWGGGKSSVMRMLERDLNSDDYEDVACLYFNGWVFEGYDDAKAALLSSILMQLGEHKRVGPKVRERIVQLLKKINVMRALKLGFNRVVMPIATAAVAAGVASGQIDAGTATLATGALAAVGGKVASGSAGADAKEEPIDWQDLINKDPSAPGPLDIRGFRDDFEKLLAETELTSLVVLIDDLDRCAPDRLIENLEAIKLFLAVPGTAFVIAADQRIVRHAIAARYKTKEVEKEQGAAGKDYDLAKEYLEKLIQIPYHLPRLSPSEIESYMTLLFCRLHLDEDFEAVREHCELERAASLYITYGAGHVRKALTTELPEELAKSLQWASSIAPGLTESLKGNPRQVKRFLNALLLRKQLAEIAKLSNVRDDVLVKLMLLEYSRDTLFDKLYEWQAVSNGYPPQLAALESEAHGTGVASSPDLSKGRSAATKLADGDDVPWKEDFVQAWLRADPSLQDIDLRDYFWIARDRLTSSISGVSMVSPFVRTLFTGLISDVSGDRNIAAGEAKGLESDEMASLLRLLGEQLQRRPSEPGGLDGLVALADEGVEAALDTLLDALDSIPAENVPADVAFTLSRLSNTSERIRPRGVTILKRWETTSTAVGRAAKDAIKDVQNANKVS